MSTTDKVLKLMCRSLAAVFGLLAVLAAVACMFGILIAMHIDDSTATMEQVRAIGVIFLVSFVAGAAFTLVADNME